MKSNTRNLLCAVSAVTLVMAIATLALAAQKQAEKKDGSPEGVKYQPLNVKPGLWENTLSITRTGEMPIPPEMLARLSPEQRARMEQRMKANAAAQSHTVTDKQCLTQEDLEKPNFLENAERQQQCVVKILESTSTTASGKMSCQSEAGKMDGALEVKAPDPEHMNSTWHATVAGSGHTMNVDAKASSKWLGSSCETGK